jgi:hypothetical protein
MAQIAQQKADDRLEESDDFREDLERNHHSSSM